MSLKISIFLNPSLNTTAFEHRSCHVGWLWVAIEIVNIFLYCLCRTTSYYADWTWDLLYFCFFLKIVFAISIRLSINFQSHFSCFCHRNIRLRDWVYNTCTASTYLLYILLISQGGFCSKARPSFSGWSKWYVGETWLPAIGLGTLMFITGTRLLVCKIYEQYLSFCFDNIPCCFAWNTQKFLGN